MKCLLFIIIQANLELHPAAPKKLHSYQPQEVAEELCLMDAELIRKIRPEELGNGGWMKEDKVGRES